MNNHVVKADLQRVARNSAIEIDFVSPIRSVCLAAVAQVSDVDAKFTTSDAESYGTTVGLVAALKREVARFSSPSMLSYSRLARLATAADVNSCNEITGRVISANVRRQVGDRYPFEINSAIGELHDNAAEHAQAQVAYSACQVYSGKGVLEFAIADVGRGMPWNVRRFLPEAKDWEDWRCIEWCCEEGNTTAPSNEWDQLVRDPLPGFEPEYSYRESANNHLGVGLSDLVKLVRTRGGQLWILSQGGEYSIAKNGTAGGRAADVGWRGVMIELELPTT